MIKLFTRLFGTKSERDLKELTPYVGMVNGEFVKLASLSNDELRQQAADLKEFIAQQLKSIDEQINLLKQQAEDEPDVDSKESIFKQIDALDLDRNKELENVLLQILPKAFAIVKETARRFKENEKLEVTASFFDREIATKKSHVTIEGEKAYWKSTWDVMGLPIKWDMVHYDVQIIGGVVLHQGKIAEMATGEGKTLVATLPAFLNALAGRGVHIVTVNDYLAKRDSEWMAPLFEFHGMRVDCIDKHQPNTLSTPQRLPGRHHLRYQQRIWLRLPARQHGPRTAMNWCSANTITPWWMRLTPY